MAGFRAEVLRWNRRINLVSRQGAEDQIRRLESQCRETLDPVLTAMGPTPAQTDPELLYFDLGSGNGFPGFVWHILMCAKGLLPATHLVEPRSKRAWFLRRLGALEGAPPFTVVESRWGNVPALSNRPLSVPPAPLRALVSLKALRLPDPEVLGGFQAALLDPPNPPAGQTAVSVARFCPSGLVLSAAVCADLGIPRTGGRIQIGQAAWLLDEARILPAASPQGETAVIFSRYSRNVEASPAVFPVEQSE